MKQITKIFIGTLVLGILGTYTVFAQEQDVNMLRTKMSELRQTHAELKAQVEAGTLTKEEAREQWQKILEEFRSEKEAVFKARMDKVEQAYQTMLEKNPERAEIFKQHIDAAKSRREAIAAKRQEINTQIKDGSLTRQEGQRIKIEAIKAEQTKFMDIKKNIQEQRQNLRQNNIQERKDTLDQNGAIPRPGAAQGNNAAGIQLRQGIDGNPNRTQNNIVPQPLGFQNPENGAQQRIQNDNSIRPNAMQPRSGIRAINGQAIEIDPAPTNTQ